MPNDLRVRSESLNGVLSPTQTPRHRPPPPGPRAGCLPRTKSRTPGRSCPTTRAWPQRNGGTAGRSGARHIALPGALPRPAASPCMATPSSRKPRCRTVK
eukprot:676028-Heterocapsa_arctica.AAC.1